MGTSIVDRLNGKTFQSKNELYNKQVIQVYVENEEDVPFWKYFFDKRNLKTKISPADKGSVERGKQSVLAFADKVNKHFVLCVDSDFDYLLQNGTTQSKLVNNNPYIFHTYTHSIESFKCYSGILHKVVVDSTLNDNETFDYTSFLEEYSNVIFDLFVYFFYFEKKHQIAFENYSIQCGIEEKRQSKNDFFKWKQNHEPIHVFPLENGFNKNIKILNQIKDKNDITIQLDLLKKQIEQTLSTLPSIDKSELNTLKDELFELGVIQSNTYLFIQGHVLLNNIVLMFLNPIFNLLKDNVFDEYTNAKKNTTDTKKHEHIENVREHYKKIVFTSKRDEMSTIERVLFNHKYFDECPFAEKIFNSIDSYTRNNHNMNYSTF